MCQVSVVALNATESDALTKAAFILPRATVLGLADSGRRMHVLRMEGECGPSRSVWTTPFSAEVFTRKPERP
jgi:hypothetical protein